MDDKTQIERLYSVAFPASGEVYLKNPDEFEYYYCSRGNAGGPWVTFKKDLDLQWYYIRLNGTSESKRYSSLQECINIAYEDMARSKY